jgi:hypothetical protein
MVGQDAIQLPSLEGYRLQRTWRVAFSVEIVLTQCRRTSGIHEGD